MAAEDTERALGRIEGKLDAMLLAQTEHASRLNRQDEKINSLERWRATLVGAWAVLSLFVSLVIAKLGKFI